MMTKTPVSDAETFDLNSENTWIKLYPSLEALARCFVYSMHVPSWRGQENDIVADIVQETWRRLIERSLKAERGEAPPIHSLKQMMAVVAQNYCRDLRRRDRRLVRVQPQDAARQSFIGSQTNWFEASTENVYQESLFKLIAREVANFPDKQRRAILIDMANRMHFGKKPTPLQAAFLEVGIDLRQYK